MVEQDAPSTPEYSTAKRALYDVLDSEAFFDRLHDQHISPEADDTPAYWRVAGEVAQTLYPESDDESFQNSLNRLTLVTPYFAFVQYAMDYHKGSRIPDDLWQHFRRTASRYNETVRTTAEHNPDLSVRQLQGHLGATIDLAVPDHAVSHMGPEMLRAVIEGARHEMGFGQIATAAGLEMLPTTTGDDLKACDWKLRDEIDRLFRIDVKSNIETLRKHGSGDRPYVIHHDGKIMMHSLIEDEEFGDRMYISDEAAAAKAPKLLRYLDEIATILRYRQTQHQHRRRTH